MQILNAYKYEGSIFDLQKEIPIIQNGVTLDILKRISPLIHATEALKDIISTQEPNIDTFYKVATSFWNYEDMNSTGLPHGGGYVFFRSVMEGGEEKYEIYVKFHGVSNLLLQSYMSERFVPFNFEQRDPRLSEEEFEGLLKEEGSSIEENERHGEIWGEIFLEEGIMLYRGFRFEVIHYKSFENELLEIKQKILSKQNPELYQKEQAMRRQRVETVVIDRLLRGNVVDVDVIVTLSKHHGAIFDTKREIEDFILECQKLCVDIKKDIESQPDEAADLKDKIIGVDGVEYEPAEEMNPAEPVPVKE